jgi:hypothetical protein
MGICWKFLVGRNIFNKEKTNKQPNEVLWCFKSNLMTLFFILIRLHTLYMFRVFYACGSIHLVLKLGMVTNLTYTFC